MADEKEYQHEITLDDGPGTGVPGADVDTEPKPKAADDDLQIEIDDGPDPEALLDDAPAPRQPAKPAKAADDEPPAQPPPRQIDPEVIELRRRIEAMQEDQARRDAVSAKAYWENEDRELDSKISVAREKYKKAMAEGDSDAALAATDELTELKVDKRARQYQREAVAREAQARPQQQAPAENPLTARWKALNPWYGQATYGAETLAMRAIDSQMVAEGWQPNSEAYYDEMSKRLKKKMPEAPVTGLTAPRKDNPPPRTAPARTQKPAGSTVPGKPGVVRLTQTDLQVMRQVGMDPDSKTDRIAYAKQKIAYQE